MDPLSAFLDGAPRELTSVLLGNDRRIRRTGNELVAEAEIEALRSALSNLAAPIDNYRVMVRTLEKDLADAKREMEKTHSELSALRSSQQDIIERWRQEVAETRAENTQLGESLVKANKTLADIQKILSTKNQPAKKLKKIASLLE